MSITWQLPDALFFVDSIPRTSVTKFTKSPPHQHSPLEPVT